MRPGVRRLWAAALAASTALSLVSPAAAQRAAGMRPATADSVEAGLWADSDKAEMRAKSSAELDADPALHDYVRGVACKVASEYCKDIRVYVLDRPFFNAAMAPNGYMEVWSGLLLRVDSEAELAFVLGHETSHYAQNHSLQAWHAVKSRADGALVLTMVIAVAGAGAAAGASTASGAQSISNITQGLIDVVYLGALASIFQFDRSQEAEADMLGAQRARKAGYAVSAAGDAWRALIAESQASDFEKVRKSEVRASIFNTHPLTTDRLKALEAQSKTLEVGGDVGHERYRAAIRPHLASWLHDDLRRRDFGETLNIIDRLAAHGEDLGVLNYFRGEAFRLRAKGGDLFRAREAYATAVKSVDAPAAAWRELGDLQRKDHDTAAARAAYTTYLAKAPDADDAWIVKDSLATLERGN